VLLRGLSIIPSVIVVVRGQFSVQFQATTAENAICGKVCEWVGVRKLFSVFFFLN